MPNKPYITTYRACITEEFGSPDPRRYSSKEGDGEGMERGVEERSGVERRSGEERRSGVERNLFCKKGCREISEKGFREFNTNGIGGYRKVRIKR